MKQGATSLATFLYDADGNRVKGTVSSMTTVYIGGVYKRQGAAYTSYYEGGGLRRSGYASNNGVFYMLSDHLKSTSALVARNGVLNVKYFYYPYGARRGVPFNTITAKHFAGQYHETSLPGGEGLSFYNARWYDPKLGRFLSADTIVPNASNPQSLNRYTYVLGNPLKYIDPTGHRNECGATTGGGCGGGSGTTTWTPSPPVYGPAPRPASQSSGGNGASSGNWSGLSGNGGGGSYFGSGQTTTTPKYSPDASTRQAWLVVFSWFSESGPKKWYFGPEYSLTQDVMYDPGMKWFRQIWSEAGYPVPFRYEHTADVREGSPLPVRVIGGGWVFVREHLVQLPLSTAGYGSKEPQGTIDPVGGIIGSLDEIEVASAGNGLVRFTVHNVMGWESATRIPGTTTSLIQNRNRGAPGPGGTIEQYFYWWEPAPRADSLIVAAH